MLRRGTAGRRLGLAVAIAAIGALVYAGVSLADSDLIVAGPAEQFSQPTYNTDQGAVVQFQDNGGTHNVTARQTGPDGKALFRSPTIDSGSAAVDGTQYLPAGDYPFFCTVHPTTMNGTLHVTGVGVALARPSASLKLRTKKIAKALKRGLLIGVTANTKVDGASLVAKLGKTTIGRASGLSWFAGPQVDVVKLNKAGKSKLRSKGKATVKVTADIPFGSPVTAKAKLK